MTHTVVRKPTHPSINTHADAVACSVVKLVRKLTGLDGAQLSDEERRQIYKRVVEQLNDHANSIPF